MPIRFFNTLSRSEQEFHPISAGEVRMYTCGPTVYNYAHIGNFRAYVFEDLLRRALRLHNYRVTQVMNLTDVDDKTIRGSREAGVSLDAFTATYKKAFFEDIATLHIQHAEHYPEATSHIAPMIRLIETLLEKGFAYRGEDGCVYFSIERFPEYGKLARIDRANQLAGARIRNDEYAKDAVADFALWKTWDEADGAVGWDSPWGRGRPGWHIECSAMSMEYLGKTFDLHTGGVDNMFPHHEDEIAQSEAANGCRYVNYWLHCEHLMVDGEKMSKSLGNFHTLRDVLARGYEGRDIRWVLLSTHYRKKLNFTFDACDQAKQILKRFRDLFQRLLDVSGPETMGDDLRTVLSELDSRFLDAIGDDLNVSEAFSALFSLEKEANLRIGSGTLGTKGACAILDQFRKFDQVFACLDVDEGKKEVPPEIQALADARQAARKAKDFARADAVRDQLKTLGWQIEDTPAGPRPKRI